MPSEHPIHGRCGAKCIQNTGLMVLLGQADAERQDYGRYDDDDLLYLVDPESYGDEDRGYKGYADYSEPYEKDAVREIKTVVIADWDDQRATFEGDEIDEEIIDTLHGAWDLVEVTDTDGQTYVTESDGGEHEFVHHTGAQKEMLGFCELFPMQNGRCYRHGGHGNQGEEGNARNLKHGLNAKNSVYYDNLDADGQAQIDMWFESFMEEAEERNLFSRMHTGKVEILRGICIDLHKKRNANEYIVEEGLVEEVPLTDQDGEIVIGPDGEPITLAEENTLNLPIDRLDRTMMKKLKELGFLDDPESENAKATKSLAEQLAETGGD